MEDDDDDKEGQDDAPAEPVNYLCPACEEVGKENIFDSIKSLAAHYNWRHKTSSTPGFKEIKDKIKTTAKPPTNIKEEKEPEHKPSQKPKEKGVKMPSDTDEEHIEPELGDAARVRGTIKQLLVKIGKLPLEERNALLPEREQLLEFMKSLTLKNIEIDVIREIETKTDIDIAPKITSFAADLKGGDDQDDDENGTMDDLSMDLRMKKEKLRSNIKKDLLAIADLPSDIADTVSAEREMLIELNRRLVKNNLTKKDLNEIEAQHTSFRPFVDAASKKSRRKKGGQDDRWTEEDDEDDDIEDRDSLKRVKNRLKRMRYMRELKEEQAALDKMSQATDQENNNRIQMVPVTRPKIDPQTGQMLLDKDRQPIMETTYQYATPTGMDPLMQTMFQTMLMTLINPNRGSSDKIAELMLEMKKEEYDWRRHQLETELNRERNNPARDEISELRQMNQNMMQQFYQTQVNQMQQQLNNARAAANRDTLGELLEEKDRLMQLGIVSDPRMQNQEQQTQAYAKEVLNEASSKLDKTTQNIKELAQPIIDMNAQILRRRIEKMDDEEAPHRSTAASRQPAPMTEEEKEERWSNILHTIDQQAGGE